MTKIAQGWPKLWANFRALIGIFSQRIGPSLAIWANPVQFSLYRGYFQHAKVPICLRPDGGSPCPGCQGSASFCSPSPASSTRATFSSTVNLLSHFAAPEVSPAGLIPSASSRGPSSLLSPGVVTPTQPKVASRRPISQDRSPREGFSAF
jgi:hypothetical protein